MLMRIYTDDPDMIAAGAEYLRVVGFSYLFLSLSQPYLSAMKSIEQVRVSTVLNSVALVLNIGLNAAFIFGWIPGIPPLGFIAAFVWNLPPLWVYLILSCDEFAKMPFVYIRYRQKKWLRNITKEVTA
ncbi:MAG: MATE family efflux transporter [Acutalibacteraceae bacterium]|nr:MATE family efflux transporter [Acutalibacteraceae bacterium]